VGRQEGVCPELRVFPLSAPHFSIISKLRDARPKKRMSIRWLLALVGSVAVGLFLLLLSWDIILEALIRHHISSELASLEVAQICEEEAAKSSSLASLGVPVAGPDGPFVLSPSSWRNRETRMRAKAISNRTQAAYHSAQVKIYLAMKRWPLK
jgi:hypothetical protein